MKRWLIVLTVAAMSVLSMSYLVAQPPSGSGGPPGGGRGPGSRPGPEGGPSPLIAVLDADHDHVISAKEIENAVKALKSLDKNGDGKLTPDEFAGAGPGRGPEGGGPGEPSPGGKRAPPGGGAKKKMSSRPAESKEQQPVADVETRGGIQWFATLERGLAEAKRSGKPILFVSAAPHCGGISGIW